MIASTIKIIGRGFLLPESSTGEQKASIRCVRRGEARSWHDLDLYISEKFRVNKMNELLNPQQRSSLRMTLQSFEKNLREAQSWLDGGEEDGILYKVKVRITKERRQQVTREITEALNQIRALSQSFELEKKEENPLSLICSEMVISWANLLDSRSAKLGRYGDVSAGLAEKLDPAVINLAETALYLSKIFEDLSINRSDKNV